MNLYLRAWRKHRGLSQEQVAGHLSVKHTTVGRWEKGMRLSAEDLHRLAQVYGVSVSQLSAPPESANLVATLDEVQSILDGMDEDTKKEWLSIGRKLKVK